MDETLGAELKNIADKNDALILSFVAPSRALKVSPVGVLYAQIDVEDLYNIEEVIDNLQQENALPKNLHLVIHTPGGLAHVSTKIANYLRKTFEDIHAFVPYEASSGGTVMCLAANRITMGHVANLTPIDPQTRYKNERVSSTSYQLAIREVERRFGKKMPLEIPPPYQQMAEKFDPIILTEMNKSWENAADVALELLKKSYDPQTEEDFAKVQNAAITLAFTHLPHAHMIDPDEALEIGLNIQNTNDNMVMLRTYKKWVKSMLNEEKASHVIAHFIPAKQKQTAVRKAFRRGKPATKRGIRSTKGE